MTAIMERAEIKVVRPGEGEHWCGLGEKFAFKLGPEDTGGIFSLTEVVAQPRNGPPLHLHRREDELFYVLEGDFAFSFQDRVLTRSKGFAVHLPKNMPHTYNNIGSRAGRMLVITIPCGFEGFIRAWAHPIESLEAPPPPPCESDLDRLVAAAPKYGIELLPEAKCVPDFSAPPAERAYWVLGQLVTMKLTGKETNGQFSAVEVTTAPGTGVPPHWHRAMDEVFYILEGTYEFSLGSRVESVGPGALVYVPRGETHGFRNAGGQPARMFDLHTPAGFEAFFEEAGVPVADPARRPAEGPPDMERLLALFRRHGMEIP